MENLTLSFSVVLPLFIMTWLGYLLKKLNLYNDTTLYEMNNVSFRVFLPILLFINIYKTNLETSFNPTLIVFSVCSLTFVFLASCFLIPRIEPDNRKRGVLIQAIFRNNFILFGLPITISIYGDGNTGVVSILIAIIVPILNVLSVLSLEIFREGKINYKKIFKGVITNPLIIGSFVGGIFLLTGIKLPVMIEKTITDLSKVTTPLALMILGGSFQFGTVKGGIKQIAIGIMGRLVIVPIIFIPISVMLGFRNLELVALLAMFATPPAVSSFTMAQQMGADSDLAGQIVVFSTVFCIFTLFIWVFVLKQFMFI